MYIGIKNKTCTNFHLRLDDSRQHDDDDDSDDSDDGVNDDDNYDNDDDDIDHKSRGRSFRRKYCNPA